jgi:SAM-dependent methyltransferase
MVGSFMKCILCFSEKCSLIEDISFSDLKKLYLKKGISIQHLRTSDIFQYYECDYCRLRFFIPLITGDEFFYNQLQNFDWYYLDDKEEYKFASQYVKKSSKLLEVGSGKGAFAKYTSLQDYTGLEYSQSAINMAKLNNINILRESIENFADCKTDYFDIVCSFQVLEHVPDPYNFLKSKVRALKPDGNLILSIPSEESFLKYAINDFMNMPPHHLTRWKDHTLEFIAELFNLILLEIHHEKVSPIHLKWYTDTLLQSVFLEHKIIDFTYKRILFSKISSILSRLLFANLNQEMLPHGHTVTAVYKKL